MKQLSTIKRLTVAVVFLLPVLIATKMIDKNEIIAKGATLEKLGEGFKFTEGPTADKEGNVFFTDQPNNKIIRWSAATGEFSTFSSDAGRSNGMYFDKSGRLIACADMQNQVWAFDKEGKHTVLVENYQGKLLNGPNDVWVTPSGGIYLTDPMYKRAYWQRDAAMQQDGEHVYYLSPDKKQFIRVEESLEKPNGIVGTPDGKKLYIADIGANKTYVYDIGAGGKLLNKQLFAPMGSDGMTIDEKGNVYLTGKGVTVFDKQGKQIAHIPVPADWTANVCFGGKNHQMLFITAMDAVYGLKMKVKGVATNF